jgi:hypothetical protein
MRSKSKTVMVETAGLMLAIALSLPAQGQRPNHDRPPMQQRQSASRREAARPPRQEHPFVRERARSPESFRRRPQSQPAYSRPGAQERTQGYPDGHSREVAHPRSPAESRRQVPASSYAEGQRHEVPRPPTRGQPHSQGSAPRFAQEQRREVAHPPSQPPTHPQGPGTFAPGQGHEVPRPPQGSSPLSREVPRPPQAGQHHGGDWLRTHREQPLADQQRALQSDPQFRKLPPQQQQRLEQRLQHFNSLPPQEQQRRLNRIETWEHLTPQQKQQARHLATQWQQLPPQRRQMMKTAIGDLRAMPPDQRERVLDSDRFKNMFSDQERDMLRDTTKLPLAPAQPGVPRPPQE